MKNSIIMLLLIVALSNISFAQLLNNWGIKGGVNISNQSWDYNSSIQNHEYDNQSGLNLAVFIEFLNLSYLNISAELSYLQLGIKDNDLIVTKIANTSMGYEDLGPLNYRFDYLSFGLFGKLKYNLKSFTPYLLFGPKLKYLIGENEQVGLIKDNFNDTNIAFTLGMGTETNLTFPITFIFEIRYSKDFTDSYKADDLSVKNRYFEFLFGVKL